MSAPPDLTLTYHWVAPTIRPPYHHEYTIQIGPGLQGQVSYIPDYANHNPPRWVETFTASAAGLDALYALLLSNDAFRSAWKQQQPAPIGGEQTWLDITAGGQRASIPAGLAGRDAAAAQKIFEAVRAMVPQSIWDKLEAQRQEYIKQQLK